MFYSVHVSFSYQVCLKYTAKIITKLFKFISDVSTNPGKSEISHFEFYVFFMNPNPDLNYYSRHNKPDDRSALKGNFSFMPRPCATELAKPTLENSFHKMAPMGL